jgi:hypothetical protein
VDTQASRHAQVFNTSREQVMWYGRPELFSSCLMNGYLQPCIPLSRLFPCRWDGRLAPKWSGHLESVDLLGPMSLGPKPHDIWFLDSDRVCGHTG